MILTLVRELRRSQGRYARSALVLVLLAVALASFTMVSVATRASEDQRATRAAGFDRDHLAWVSNWTNGPRVTPANYMSGDIDDATLATITHDIAAADPQALINEQFIASVVGLEDFAFILAPNTVPPLALAQGRAPGKGEVAISPALAAALKIGVGDNVTFTERNQSSGPHLTLTVSGILRTASWDSGSVGQPTAIASSLDAGAMETLAFNISGLNADGDPTTLSDHFFTWDGAVPASAAPYTSDPGAYTPKLLDYAGTGEWLAMAFAALITLATLVAAGVAGRNQGQARSQWVGTMRALGATRRDVVSATLVEAGITGALAAVLGGALGWGINAALLARTQAGHPGTFLPTVAPYPAWALAITAVIGILLAGALGGVPAYWASRTSPSEALKPTSPFDSRPPTWRVSTWVFGAVAAGAGLIVWIYAAGPDAPFSGAARWVILPGAVAILAATGLVSRLVGMLVPGVGARLARSRLPWLFAAGDSLSARPTQATGVATVFAIPGAGIGVLAWIAAVMVSSEDGLHRRLLPWPQAALQAGTVALAASAVLGVAAAVLGVAVWMGRGRDTAEAATRGALGLSRNSRQMAAMTETSVAAFVGGAVGVTLGLLGTLVARLSLVAFGGNPLPVGGPAIEIAARVLLMYAGGLVGVFIGAAVVSLWSARSVDAKTPAAARRVASTEGAS